jgi:prepilin-type N-terminal cleavage/methylation domain-containing protein
MRHEVRSGFTLTELLVYIALFSVVAVFLVGILTTVTRTQVRQASSNEVGREVSFVSNIIQRYIQGASVIENTLGVSTGTLIVRMGIAATSDRVRIYADAERKAMYLEEIPEGQSAGIPTPLTSAAVSVGQFVVTPTLNPGGTTIVQVDLTLVGTGGTPASQITRSWRSAITRISAATFDSNLLPSSGVGPNRSLGTSLLPWQDLFLSGSISASGTIGIGISPPTTPARLRATGDIGITTSTAGIVLTAPNGTSCYRLGVSNTGLITTSSVACPGSW